MISKLLELSPSIKKIKTSFCGSVNRQEFVALTKNIFDFYIRYIKLPLNMPEQHR